MEWQNKNQENQENQEELDDLNSDNEEDNEDTDNEDDDNNIIEDIMKDKQELKEENQEEEEEKEKEKEDYYNLYPLNKIETNCRIVILQHKNELNESKLKVSSVPFLTNILQNYSNYIITENKWKENEEINNENCVVLYPSESSITISEYLQTKQKPKTIYILDGSWVTVQECLYNIPQLQPNRITHIRLSLDQLQNRRSIYHTMGLRKEPAINFISTAEAIAMLLLYLEPENEAPSYILRVFQQFVSTQTKKLSSNYHENDYRKHDTFQEILLPDHGLKKKKKLTHSQIRSRKRSKEKRKRKHH